MKKAYAYARFSSDNQREESIEAQFYEIKKYAAAEGILIEKYFCDEAVSGRTTNRPEFLAMLDEVFANGGIDYIIVHKVDRFSRDKYQSAILKEKLSRRGVKVLYAAQKIADTPEGGLMESILEGFAEYYSNNLSEETKKGLYTNARKAKFNGGSVPFGFDVDEDRNYIINSYEAVAVKLMYDLYLQGLSQTQIAEEINKKGYKTRYGKDFTDYSVKYILTSPKYCGTYQYGKITYTYGANGKRNLHIENPDDQIVTVKDAIPKIVDEEVFEKVQEMIKRRANQRQPRQKVTYALKGKIFCSCCGSPMSGSTNGRNIKYSYYRCKSCGNRIKRDPLEKYILTAAKSFILENSDRLVELIEKEVQKMMDTKDTDRAALKKRYDQIEREENNCVDFIMQMGANEKLKEKLEELEIEKKSIEKALSIDMDPINLSKEVRIWINKIKNESADTILSKKDLIQLMVRKVEVDKEEVKIYFNFCPSEVHRGVILVELPLPWEKGDSPRMRGGDPLRL